MRGVARVVRLAIGVLFAAAALVMGAYGFWLLRAGGSDDALAAVYGVIPIAALFGLVAFNLYAWKPTPPDPRIDRSDAFD